MNKDPRRNASGCSDPTAYQAITNLDMEEKHFQELIKTIKYLCRLAGFEIEGRIVLKNHRSGRVYK